MNKRLLQIFEGFVPTIFVDNSEDEEIHQVSAKFLQWQRHIIDKSTNHQS